MVKGFLGLGKTCRGLLALLMATVGCAASGAEPAAGASRWPAEGSADFLSLFAQWQQFEHPTRSAGAPDYTRAAMAAKAAGLVTFKARLEAIDPTAWPTSRQVDYELLRGTYPFCRLTGPANVLVMPGLHSAHISSRLMQRLGGVTVIGPVIDGLQKPMQIVQMGSTVSDLVNHAALAAYGALNGRR